MEDIEMVNQTAEKKTELAVQVQVAGAQHLHMAEDICTAIETSAKQRGTGIAKRSPEYIGRKILNGHAIVAATPENVLAGFCYIESWEHGRFVANSGLIVLPEFRGGGLARRIKTQAFLLSRKLFPEAKLFGLTTNESVMNINSDLGYRPVTFSSLTQSEEFWLGCSSCTNFPLLETKNRKLCLCTAMLFDPNKETPAWRKEQ